MFVAGTGILSLIDYLARFVLYNCAEALGDQGSTPKVDQIFGPNYKLMLFYAVESEENAIALDMLRLLKKVCKKLGRNNFKLYVRFSEISNHPMHEQGETALEIWDYDYVYEKVKQWEFVRKIFVCGTPQIN